MPHKKTENNLPRIQYTECEPTLAYGPLICYRATIAFANTTYNARSSCKNMTLNQQGTCLSEISAYE